VRVRLLGLAAAVGLVAAAASATAAPSTTIVGGSRAVRTVLRQILAGLGPSHLSELGVVSHRNGIELRTDGATQRSTWAALVVGGAYTERSSALRLPLLLEVQAGSAGWPTSNLSNVPTPPRATAATVASTRAAVSRAIAGSGARITELSVSKPYALAVAIRLKAGNAAWFMHHRLSALIGRMQPNESRYEGTYLEVDDGQGQAWISAETRLGGVTYVRPSLRGCDPFPPPGGPPGGLPPCPA
jgi:hypothetical protein